MNKFEEGIIKHIGSGRLKKIQNVKIAIAGAGGLGSNCALNLVRCGFKHFKIIDFDVVEAANLSRQFYFLGQLGTAKVDALKENLLKINPDLNIETSNEKINEHNIGDLFKNSDVVVEAFDKPCYKRMLVEYYYNSAKLLIAASGLAGWGESDKIRIKKVHNSFYIVGDMTSEATSELPPLSPKVNIAAAKQADIILNWVLSKEGRK